MTLSEALLHAAVGGLATTLPISASAHRAVAQLWLGGPGPGPALTMGVAAGCAVAMAAAVHQRLWLACWAGLRGLRRLRTLSSSDSGKDFVSVVLAGGVSIGVELLIEGPLSHASQSAVAVGLGLMLTAVALGSTAMAPTPRRLRPSALGSVLIGLAHGLGMAPGASQVGAAFVVASWLGIRGWRAVQLAFMVAVPPLLCRAARSAAQLDAVADMYQLPALLVLPVAGVAAGVAALVWHRLSERRATLWLLIWLVPLSLATLAYGHAAPGGGQPVHLGG